MCGGQDVRDDGEARGRVAGRVGKREACRSLFWVRADDGVIEVLLERMW